MEHSPWAFVFPFVFILFLPPTPNPLPSGKRALRFASPGFYFSPLFYCPQAHPLRWVGLLLFLAVYLGQLVLRQSSCDGEAPLQLLHSNL